MPERVPVGAREMPMSGSKLAPAEWSVLGVAEAKGEFKWTGHVTVMTVHIMEQSHDLPMFSHI